MDGAGNTGSVVASGSIPDTDLLSNTEDDEIPNPAYFTGPIWPALKNHTGADGAVDNFCYELLDAPVTAVRFAAFGDYGSDNANELAVANLVDSFNSRFLRPDRRQQLRIDGHRSQRRPVLQRLHRQLPGLLRSGKSDVNRFFPALGNHDYTDGGGFNAYRAYFDLPGAGITGSDPSGEERYYEFVQGPVHFFVIDSNPGGIGSPPAPGDGRSATSVQALVAPGSAGGLDVTLENRVHAPPALLVQQQPRLRSRDAVAVRSLGRDRGPGRARPSLRANPA